MLSTMTMKSRPPSALSEADLLPMALMVGEHEARITAAEIAITKIQGQRTLSLSPKDWLRIGVGLGFLLLALAYRLNWPVGTLLSIPRGFAGVG